MKDRSCQTNLVSFNEEVHKTLDKGVAVDVVYLDFAKAFDTVSNTGLMCKVKSTGLEISVCKWIENWLKDRIQRVVVNDSYSEWSKVISVVPQGSVSGPLLFLKVPFQFLQMTPSFAVE